MKGVALAAGVAVLLGGCVPLHEVGKTPPPETAKAAPGAGSAHHQVVPKPRPDDLGAPAKTKAAEKTKAPAQPQAIPDPKAYHVVAKALWDGRPSLGGVWVAAPNAEPRHVIIRNPANGKTVLGAVFPRETFYPGPPLQLSAEAAVALGLLPGQPATLSVTAVKPAPATAKQ